MKLKLWFAPGSCSRVPMVALEEAGAAFDTELLVFMRGDHRSPAFLAVNPAGKVPALQVDDAVLTQNVAILMWIAQAFPAAQLLPRPADALESSVLLARLLWFSSDLHPLVTRIRMPQLICSLQEGSAQVRAQAIDTMALQLAGIEATLKRQPWVLGDRWSLLDAYLYWVWFRINSGGFDPSAFPALRDHGLRMEQRPAVQRAIAREKAAQAQLEALGKAIPGPLQVTPG